MDASYLAFYGVRNIPQFIWDETPKIWDERHFLGTIPLLALGVESLAGRIAERSKADIIFFGGETVSKVDDGWLLKAAPAEPDSLPRKFPLFTKMYFQG